MNPERQPNQPSLEERRGELLRNIELAQDAPDRGDRFGNTDWWRVLTADEARREHSDLCSQ